MSSKKQIFLKSKNCSTKENKRRERQREKKICNQLIEIEEETKGIENLKEE